MAKPFNGTINVDIRDSVPDWDAFLPDKAPDGAPNVLVLYDDTGCAAWSPYGGRIEMPTMQRLADGGLTYQGGVCDPLVISWPKGISAKGEVQDRVHGRQDHQGRLRRGGRRLPRYRARDGRRHGARLT